VKACIEIGTSCMFCERRCAVTVTSWIAPSVVVSRRAYYGAVSYVDDQIGTLMTTLHETRLDANAIVLVLADHGDMLGERGLWYKMSFFEPACRIPLIVCAPGRFAARRIPEPASMLDVLPTFLDFAQQGGGSPPQGSLGAPIEGRSLLPALKGEKLEPRELLGEYLAEGAIAPIVMIRRGRYKFIHCPADPDQLYDLTTDLDECTNLAKQGAYATLVHDFRAEVARRWDLRALNEAVLASQRRRHAIYAALRQGRYQSWDFQPHRDASRLYIRNDQELDDLEAMARFPRPS
jgi:choline-sulfatase